MALPHPLKSFDCLVAVEGFFLRFEVDGFDLFFVVAFENFSRARDNGSIQSIVCVKKHIVTLQLAQISAAQRPAFNDEQNENGQTFDFRQGVVPFTG